MRKTGLVLSVAVAFLLMFCVCAEAFKLPDTGQTKCYQAVTPWSVMECTGTGQDGAYAVNLPSFTDHSDGTVTDNVTGLKWQKCHLGQTNNLNCTGDYGIYNWYQATGTYHVTYNPDGNTVGCGTLPGGSWRLPAVKELMSIVNFSYDYPSIDENIFPNTRKIAFLTNTAVAVEPDEGIWTIDFRHGYVETGGKTIKSVVRCVSGSTITPSFTSNGDTITDNNTSLEWQRYEPVEGAMTWGAALAYCNNLALAGKNDWRLPNVKELESLLYEADYDPAIHTVFPAAVSSWYWTSTSDSSYPEYAWLADFNWGKVYSGEKSDSEYVRCVRGGINSFDITANAAGTGAGSVVSTPAGISYNYPATTTGAANYLDGSGIVIAAKADAGSKASWNGTCNTVGGTEAGNNTAFATCTISSLSAAKTVTATFTRYYTITAKAKGAGKGGVVSSPAGINYKYPAKKTDSGSYAKASTVKISAKANSGYKTTWNNTCKKAGGTEKGDNTRTAVCTLKVKKAATVTATFKK
jgi:hypothetical protein